MKARTMMRIFSMYTDLIAYIMRKWKALGVLDINRVIFIVQELNVY